MQWALGRIWIAPGPEVVARSAALDTAAVGAFVDVSDEIELPQEHPT